MHGRNLGRDTPDRRRGSHLGRDRVGRHAGVTSCTGPGSFRWRLAS